MRGDGVFRSAYEESQEFLFETLSGRKKSIVKKNKSSETFSIFPAHTQGVSKEMGHTAGVQYHNLAKVTLE